MPLPAAAPWATDTNYTSGADIGQPTKTAYSAGAQAQGFLPGVEPSAEGLNEWMNRVGAWTSYLAAASVSWQDIVIGGSFTLNGVLVWASLADGLNSDVDFTGGGTLSGVYEVAVSYTGLASIFDASLGGIKGGVNGLEITIRNTNAVRSFQIISEDASSTAANRITISSNPGASALLLRPGGAVRLRYIGATSRWIVTAYGPGVLVSGFTLVSAVQMMSNQTATPSADPFIKSDGTAWNLGQELLQPVWAPVPLPFGARIDTWVVWLNKLTTNTVTVSAALNEIDLATGAATVIGSVQTNAGNIPGAITLGASITHGYTTLVDKAYRIDIFSNAGAANGDTVSGAKVQRFI